MVGAEKETDKQVLSPAIISPAAFGVVLLLVINFINHQTYSSNPKLVLGFAAGLGIFALSHFIPWLKFGKAHFFYLYMYHWLFCFMLIFIVPTLSYYLYIWVLVTYLAEYLYQVKGTLLSGAALLVAMLMGSLYQQNGINKALMLRIFTEFCIIFGVNQVLARMAFGYRAARLEMEKKIVKSEYEHSRLVALINSMSDAVIATDEKGWILTYNAAALDLLDTNATLSDMHIGEVLRLVNADNEPVDSLKLAEETEVVQHRNDLSMPLAGEDKIDLDINISRIAQSTLLARQQGYTYLLRDITKQKSLDEERDLFISEVSHELRTPITIAEGDLSMAVLLAEKPDSKLPEIKDSVIKAHDQVIFLADMVNDLSALSRAQRNDNEMKVETFQIKEVLAELEEIYRPQAEKKGIYLKLDLVTSIPKLTTSRLYFKEIMQNFVTNAIKYTDKGGVTIKGQAIDRNNIIVSVIDTGAGISKSDQAKVYQKFWRSEDPYTRSTSGTGLGLFITAKLAQRLGGMLRLQSQLKEGSTFSLLLPVNAVTKGDQWSDAKYEIANLFSKIQ